MLRGRVGFAYLLQCMQVIVAKIALSGVNEELGTTAALPVDI